MNKFQLTTFNKQGMDNSDISDDIKKIFANLSDLSDFDWSMFYDGCDFADKNFVKFINTSDKAKLSLMSGEDVLKTYANTMKNSSQQTSTFASTLGSAALGTGITLENERHPYHDAEPFLFRMLQKGMDTATARKEASRIYWNLPQKLRIITATSNNGECSNAFLLSKLQDIFSSLPDARGLIYMDRISVFCDADHIDLARLRDALADAGLIAGACAVFSDVYQMQTYHKQSVSVLTLAMNLKLEGRIFLFEDMTFYLLLSSLSDSQSLHQYIHPGIGVLEAYDKDNDTELLHTLACYIEHMGDLNQTADSLFIHHNTAKYRIQKIQPQEPSAIFLILIFPPCYILSSCLLKLQAILI